MPESPTRQHARARSLRERGVPHREIAARLGVSRTTVARWLNPAYAERDRQRSREAKRRRRRPCERCGCPLSYERQDGVCRLCQRGNATCRRARVAELYRSGLEPAAIARQLSLHPKYVSWLVGRLARAGEVEPRFAYRDARSVGDRDRQIGVLRRRRRTRREIARAVGLVPGSLSTALTRQRE
jgi:transposase